MKSKSVLSDVIKWVSSTELFYRPSKQLPGKWVLFEYYTEVDRKLINWKEDQLKNNNQFWELNFDENGEMEQKSNIPVKYFQETSNIRWQTARNYLIFARLDDSGRTTEFQYAVTGGNLKLLRKYADGKIEFFGFFRKVDPA